RIDHGTRLQHVVDRQWVAHSRLRVERGPFPRRHRDLRPLLERGAVNVHVTRRDHAEVARRAAEAVGDLIGTGEARVATGGDADLCLAALPVGDHRTAEEPMIERRPRVADHDDERAAAPRCAVDAPRTDAERFPEQGGGVLARREDTVDVAEFQTRVAHGVADGLEVQAQLALPRQDADLVALVDANDADGIPELLHRTPSGWNSGSTTSSLTLVKTTSTGMSQRIAFGSGATPMRFDIIRGPSASSIMAST